MPLTVTVVQQLPIKNRRSSAALQNVAAMIRISVSLYQQLGVTALFPNAPAGRAPPDNPFIGGSRSPSSMADIARGAVLQSGGRAADLANAPGGRVPPWLRGVETGAHF